MVMPESALNKVLRLAAVAVKSYQRGTASGRVTTVHAYQQSRVGGLRLGTPYRSAWGNVSVGDVVEFGNELWRVIPASSYPGYKPSTKSGAKTSSGTGSATGGSTTGTGTTGSTTGGSTTGTGTATGSKTGGSSTGSGGVQTYTSYLQDVRNPKAYDKLTLPSTYVVTVVPVLP